MAPRPESLELAVRLWLRWANEDLLLCRHAAVDSGVVPRGACTWAHQAAEKALKALLISYGVDPPKTHSLRQLARLLPDDPALALAGIDLDSLTRWSIEGRYPDEAEEASTDDAHDALALAEDVVAIATTEVRRALP